MLFRSETQYISEMLAKVKRFAAETKCHVWIVAHPAKANSWTNATPSLYDIAGSSNWFNKCDMGVIVHRLTADTGVATAVVTRLQRGRLSHTAGGLVEGRNYRFYVEAVNAAGTSTESPTEPLAMETILRPQKHVRRAATTSLATLHA